MNKEKNSMHDPLQIFAYLEAQQRVREEFGPASGRPRQTPVRAEPRHRSVVTARVARWLRELADRLEPLDTPNTVRSVRR